MAKKNLFPIPKDQISTPIYAPHLARAVLELIDKRHTGVFHIAGKERCSREDFVKKLVAVFGYDWKEVSSYFRFVLTSDLQQKAKRPLVAGLSTEKIESIGIRVGTFEEASRDYQV